MPLDKVSKANHAREQEELGKRGPLTEFEKAQLKKLLGRVGVTEADALAEREREQAERQKLEKQRAAMAAKEEKLAARLAQLQSDIDRTTEKLNDMTSSGPARRHVADRLQKLAEFAPTQSYFEASGFDREQIELLAEIAISMYERAAIPDRLGLSSLRERMATIQVEVGPGPPGPATGTEATAQAILSAGRKARNEEP